MAEDIEITELDLRYEKQRIRSNARERQYLRKIPAYVSQPVIEHTRGTDQYGHASFDGNFYWVPGEGRSEVKVLEFADKFPIIQNREMLIEYERPGAGKTGLATALLIDAINKGQAGRFITFPELLNEMYRAVADHSE